MLGTAEVFVIAPSNKKMICACEKCGRQYSETTGKFILGVKIVDDGQHYQYVLGVNPPNTVCCGKDVAEIKTFETDAEADQERTRVLEQMGRNQSTLGLKLLSIHPPGRN